MGRTYKTEIMNWDGATVYTSTVQTFDGRDNVVNTRQYAGNTGSSTFQDVSMTYDGHGRLKTRHYPVEDTGTDTEFFYNADGSVQQTIDPRVLHGWTLLTVHAHPLPESRADPSQGDYNNVQMNDLDAILTNAEIALYDSN